MTKTNSSPQTPSEVSKRQIYAKLAKLGIASVHIGYDGCGDSGCIESLKAYGPDDKEMQLPERAVAIDLVDAQWDTTAGGIVRTNVRRKVPLKEAVENWCYDLLEQHFGGWEINEGSQGTIELDVAKKIATFEHDENVMTTNTHTLEV
jgi:hypothetical protein